MYDLLFYLSHNKIRSVFIQLGMSCITLSQSLTTLKCYELFTNDQVFWLNDIELVRAKNLKILGTKIIELFKIFRVLTWKYLKIFYSLWTYLNSKFEFQVFPSLLENTLSHFFCKVIDMFCWIFSSLICELTSKLLQLPTPFSTMLVSISISIVILILNHYVSCLYQIQRKIYILQKHS